LSILAFLKLRRTTDQGSKHVVARGKADWFHRSPRDRFGLVQAAWPGRGRTSSRLLGEHQVLIIPGQRINLDHQKALTALLGEPMSLPYVKPMEEDPQVIRVYKGADERGGVFGGDWHSDFSFLERPPAGSVLSAHTLPPFGGDTIWASQAAAWDHLPEPLQQLLLGRDAVHVGKPYGVKWAPPKQVQSGAGVQMSRGDPAADEERLHPCVLENPHHRPQDAVRQPHLRHAARWPERGRKRTIAGAAAASHHPPGILLQAPLESRRRGHLGQPRHAALCGERLSRSRAPDVPHHLVRPFTARTRGNMPGRDRQYAAAE
jgi:hypothetical protein